MSMSGNFLLLTDAELRAVLDAPLGVQDVIDDAYEQKSDRFVDIEKAWHCLHFLLTGTASEGDPPLDFIVCGGREVGDEDVGYGPARAFTSVEVKAIADALELVSIEELARRFDGKRMDELEIYPAVGTWTEIDPKSPDSFGYFSGAFDAVKALARRGRDEGLGLLVWLS